MEWRQKTLYSGGGDFLFPSERLKKIIRPVLKRAGVQGKVIGGHSFRHSLATNLRSMG